MTPFLHQLRVRYVECDMQGVVFNAHYATWMDLAHTELWQSTVGPYLSLRERGFDLMVAELSVRFRAPAHFDEMIDIAVHLDPLTTTSMTSHHRFCRGAELLAEGTVRHVCVSVETMGKTPWPDDVRGAVERYVVAD